MSNSISAASEANLRRISLGISFAIIIASVVVAVIAVWAYDYRPQTDDATIRANFIGIAPHASGHIVELHVKDNQFVKEGDLLFVIDPRPYADAVANAKAQLVLGAQTGGWRRESAQSRWRFNCAGRGTARGGGGDGSPGRGRIQERGRSSEAAGAAAGQGLYHNGPG